MIKISNIYVNNTEVWNAGQNINATQAYTIKTTVDWGSNNLQSVWVKTIRGSEIKQVWKSQ